MPRLPLLNTRDSVPPEDRPVFDAIIECRGAVTAPVALLLHAPETALEAAKLGAYFRFRANLAPDVLELTIITTAREFDCEFVWAAHAEAAVNAGVPREVVDAIGARGETAGFPHRYRIVAEYTRSIVRDHRVEQPVFDAMRDEFGERGLTDVTALTGFYLLLACALIANDMELPAGRPGFPERTGS